METHARISEMISSEDALIETYVNGRGPALVVLPSCGRDGGEDFDAFSGLVARAGFQVLRPQPRGIGQSSVQCKLHYNRWQMTWPRSFGDLAAEMPACLAMLSAMVSLAFWLPRMERLLRAPFAAANGSGV